MTAIVVLSQETISGDHCNVRYTLVFTCGTCENIVFVQIVCSSIRIGWSERYLKELLCLQVPVVMLHSSLLKLLDVRSISPWQFLVDTGILHYSGHLEPANQMCYETKISKLLRTWHVCDFIHIFTETNSTVTNWKYSIILWNINLLKHTPQNNSGIPRFTYCILCLVGVKFSFYAGLERHLKIKGICILLVLKIFLLGKAQQIN